MRLLMASGDRTMALGAQGPFHAMLREFRRHFERIDVLAPRPGGEVLERRPYDNVHLHPATCGRAGMASYVARRGSELIGEHGHELIVSHDYGWFYNGLGSARLSAARGVPYLSEIHHVPGYPVAADLREVFDRALAQTYVRWASGRVRAFRVVNAGELPPLLESWGVPPEKILVLPSLYIDLEVLRPSEEPVEPEQDLVFVGRMVANKGLDRIADALGLLAARGRRLRALFVGRGPEERALRARLERRGVLGDARFLAWVESPAELARVYRSSRVLVCASTCEGGPRVTVEAMACGTPVVSTPVGMMKELLAEGVNGAVAGFDAASLADALERVLGDEARRVELGRRAVADVQRFEYTSTLRAYADGLKGLVGS